jgi:cysteinyl-tRNA synthetase
MSKSLGNVILAESFVKKHGPNVFRYLVLNAHYNQVINLGKELVQQAVDYTQKIKNLLKKLNFYLYIEKIRISDESKSQLKEETINSLLSNLNTIKALFFLEQTINLLNKIIDQKKSDSEELQKTVIDFYFILDLLGFKFNLVPYDLKIKLLIGKWQKLRKEGDYTRADKIRKQLQELDII